MPGLDKEMLDMVLSTLKTYCDRKLTPEYLLDIDKHETFPAEVIRDLYDPEQVGLHLLFIPEEYGGLGGGAYDIYRVSEIMAGVDLGVSTSVLATFLGTDPIAVGGTEEQKARWMGRIAEERLLVAYGATEPAAGSDLGALRTKAVPVTDDDGKITGYEITGQKQWISNGGVASLWTILADAPGGATWFVVERQADGSFPPGFSAGKPEDKHGIRASNTTALTLEDVYVPVDALIGGVEGKGLTQAVAVFGYTRLMVAAFGLGAGWDALRRVIRYSQDRIQGGAPLSQKQGYTHKLIVPNAARLEASRAYIEWVAERLDNGESGLATEGAVAKYMATEAGNKAAEDAIQGHGGYGYVREYMVEKIKRDVRITCIYEGTSEIMEWTIARDRWQAHLKSRGAYFNDWATRLDEVQQKKPNVGAGFAASAMRSLATIMEQCRVDRLTRNQHVLFRLGELIAHAETAAVFAERLATKPTTASNVCGVDDAGLEALARIHARDAIMKVATDGLRWTIGAGADPSLASRVDLAAAVAAQSGQIEDMNKAADALNRAFDTGNSGNQSAAA